MSLSSSIAWRIAGRRRAIRGLVGWLVLSGAVVACSPEFNWRETRDPEQGFVVLLPGRPAAMTREIDLEGLRVDMTMTGARVDRAMFTVGAIRLDGAAPDLVAVRDRARAAMQVAMLRNIGAAQTPGGPARVGIVDAAGAPRGLIDAVAVDATGKVGADPVVMQALFVAYREQLWQVVAITPPDKAAQARTMIESFRILAP